MKSRLKKEIKTLYIAALQASLPPCDFFGGMSVPHPGSHTEPPGLLCRGPAPPTLCGDRWCPPQHSGAGQARFHTLKFMKVFGNCNPRQVPKATCKDTSCAERYEVLKTLLKLFARANC